MNSCFVIGISGGSGSGKTTIAQHLNQSLGSRSALLFQDSYYIDQSHRFDGDGGTVNFDHPESLEFSLLTKHLKELKQGLPIEVPQYDFSTHSRLTKTVNFKPVNFVILDGTLLLSQKNIREQIDLNVFVTTSEQLRYSRRLERDVAERGRTPEGVKKQFLLQVKPMHDEFVEPSKVFAQLLLSGEGDLNDALSKILNSLQPFIK